MFILAATLREMLGQKGTQLEQFPNKGLRKGEDGQLEFGSGDIHQASFHPQGQALSWTQIGAVSNTQR